MSRRPSVPSQGGYGQDSGLPSRRRFSGESLLDPSLPPKEKPRSASRARSRRPSLSEKIKSGLGISPADSTTTRRREEPKHEPSSHPSHSTRKHTQSSTRFLAPSADGRSHRTGKSKPPASHLERDTPHPYHGALERGATGRPRSHTASHQYPPSAHNNESHCKTHRGTAASRASPSSFRPPPSAYKDFSNSKAINMLEWAADRTIGSTAAKIASKRSSSRCGDGSFAPSSRSQRDLEDGMSDLTIVPDSFRSHKSSRRASDAAFAPSMGPSRSMISSRAGAMVPFGGDMLSGRSRAPSVLGSHQSGAMMPASSTRGSDFGPPSSYRPGPVPSSRRSNSVSYREGHMFEGSFDLDGDRAHVREAHFREYHGPARRGKVTADPGSDSDSTLRFLPSRSCRSKALLYDSDADEF